jgi:hypothetical protein
MQVLLNNKKSKSKKFQRTYGQVVVASFVAVFAAVVVAVVVLVCLQQVSPL